MTLSVFESESGQKYENKCNISDIRPYPIRFHPYSVLALENRTHDTRFEDHDQVLKPARWCPLHSYWLMVAFKHYLEQEFLGHKRKLLVELFSLSLTHACKLVPLLFFNKNFLVREENCLLRDSATNFILLSATSSLFHHHFKCANTNECTPPSASVLAFF